MSEAARDYVDGLSPEKKKMWDEMMAENRRLTDIGNSYILNKQLEEITRKTQATLDKLQSWQTEREAPPAREFTDDERAMFERFGGK